MICLQHTKINSDVIIFSKGCSKFWDFSLLTYELSLLNILAQKDNIRNILHVWWFLSIQSFSKLDINCLPLCWMSRIFAHCKMSFLGIWNWFLVSLLAFVHCCFFWLLLCLPIHWIENVVQVSSALHFSFSDWVWPTLSGIFNHKSIQCNCILYSNGWFYFSLCI